MHKIHLQA